MLNIKNRTIFCKDNLDVLQGINSESVDLIYLDPPFNKNKTFTAPIGSSAEGASFKDYFREEDVKDEWVETIKEDHIELHNFLNGVKSISNSKHYLYNYCYLCYMAIRLIEMRRVLKDTGSVYFHCDPTMSHYVKIMMDTIFGEDNFTNEIVWGYKTGGNSTRFFAKKHDTLFFYSKTKKNIFNLQYYLSKQKYKYGFGKKHGYELIEKNGNFYKKAICRDFWDDIDHLGTQGLPKDARTGYPTQKPLGLLHRIIKASSKEGDVILDPFCGCATTCVASENLNRKWIGIDVSYKAYELVKERLNKEVTSDLFTEKDIIFNTDPPKRTDRNGDQRLQKYVYVISHPKFKGYYKVGIAKDYKTRLNSYQTSDPDRAYKMEYFYLTPHFRETEKYIHNLFDNKFEWIKGNLKDIVQKIKNYKHKE